MPKSRAPQYDSSLALAELTRADAKLARLIRRAGPFTLSLATAQSPFEALTESIVYQQLHWRAASAIHNRLIESFYPTHGRRHFAAEHLLEAPNEQLRKAGLSHNKSLALRDLAAKTIDGTVPTLARIRRMSDEEIIEHLTQVRGVGRWTVEMFLIFRLGRPDVFPVTDYGVRRGFALTFGRLRPEDKVTPADLPKSSEMNKRSARWEPWRSVASWYLWRACDLASGEISPSSAEK
jgi:DNA-3-methyladenine glycosylase II